MTPLRWAAASPSVICRKISSTLVQREAALILEERCQILALNVLHRDKSGSRCLTEIEDPQHVGMSYFTRQLDFPLESSQYIRVGDQIRSDQFEGDFPFQFPILCQVNGTHPTLAEEPDYPVAGANIAAARQSTRASRIAPRSFPSPAAGQ